MRKKRSVPPPTAHLKKHQFKPGQTGNPLGGKLINPELRKLKGLTQEEMVEIGSLVVKGSIEELKAIKTNPKTSVLKAMMASVAIKTIATGNAQALDILLNRLVGKVKENVVVESSNQNLNLNVNTGIDQDKLKAAFLKIKSEV